MIQLDSNILILVVLYMIQWFYDTIHHKERHSGSYQTRKHRSKSRIGILNITAHIGLDLVKQSSHRLSLA